MNENKTKKCLHKSCLKEKPLDEFTKDKNQNDGFFVWCRECKNKENKKYRDNNKERYKNYKSNRQEKIQKEWRDWYQNNKEYKLLQNKKWCENNRERRKKINNRSQKKRRNENPFYRLQKIVSILITRVLKKQKTTKNGVSVWSKLHYTSQQLKEHLENLFEPWMNWDNYGIASNIKRTWQIDHIIPQSKLPYDSLDHPNFLKCWGLENLRPLEAIANIKKGNK